MNTCTCCFSDYLVKCSDDINVNAKLTPVTTYTWVITDKFNRQYSNNAQTDGDGFLTIPITDLPEGLLTEFSGEFTLQLYELNNLCAPINFLMAQYVNCISFTVNAGTREKNNLGCQF